MSLKTNIKKINNTTIPYDWEIKKLIDCCTIKGEYGINAPAVDYDKSLPTYLRITDIDDDGRYSSEKKVSVNDVNSGSYILCNGDIVFARTGATVGKTYLYSENDGDMVFAGFLIRFKPNEKVLLPLYLKYYSLSKPYWDWVKTVSTRSGQPGINAEEYGSLKIPLPPLHEQKAIAQILSAWYKAIETTQKLIAQKKLYKKWLLQQLLSGQKRFTNSIDDKEILKTKVGHLPNDWEVIHIAKIVTRIKKSFVPEPNELYREIGIRSHAKGIFYKEPVTGLSLGDKAVFWIQPDCFIVNIVFAWEHAIAKTTENELGMIASHRFPMYKPKKNVLDLDYLLYYFTSERGKHLLGLASPGGAGRNKTLGQEEFMKLQIPVPSIEEQKSIARVIKKAEDEIQLLELKLENLKKQKKGLMQQLLTGKKKVKKR